MRTREGLRLDADVYRPSGEGDHPVLLMRQPYGRQIASTVCYAHPAWYAAHGYIVAIQDVRGRGSSEGEFSLFANEAEDGADAIAWAAALSGSTGVVGMYGFSYQGETQLLAASVGAPALKAIAPAMVGWDLRQYWAYENDAFCLAAGMSWALQLGAETAKRAGDSEAFHALFAASRALPLNDAVQARPAVIERWRRYAPHYFDWLEQDAASPYWAQISPSAHANALTAQGPPALFISGWYDTHLPGTVAAFRHYEQAGGAPARLVIGPWAHFPWGRSLGAADFGDSAVGQIDQLQISWFDQWLKGAEPKRQTPVRLFDMGANSWQDFASWQQESAAWAISGDGRAALDEQSGKITCGVQPEPGADYLVHDPWRPVPSIGGAFALPAGPAERTAIDARPDVLTYTSERLTKPLTLAGAPEAVLHLSSQSASIDASCVLSRVDPAGRAFHLTEGYRHCSRTPDAPVTIPLRPVCATLSPGERLRLSVAGASFPNFPVNPGDGANPTAATIQQARVITLVLHHEGSALRLPICP